MKIKDFNRDKGIYRFEVNGINTIFHAHPAIEIIYSEFGGIGIETIDSKFDNVSFAIIEANILHRIVAPASDVNILMIESNSVHFRAILNQLGINLTKGCYIKSNDIDRSTIIEKLYKLYNQDEKLLSTNISVQECLNYLESSSEYSQMLSTLKLMTNLSDSRISHLFKAEMGVSIKKYMVWSRLKKAFELVLTEKMNMYEAALQSGFYDQAHLSKAFKNMLGMSPSGVYNSRTLQD